MKIERGQEDIDQSFKAPRTGGTLKSQKQESNPDIQESLTTSEIPNLSLRLEKIDTEYRDKYNLNNTIRKNAIEAESVQPEKRTPEQKEVLENIAYLDTFHASPYYQDVYSPDELYDLVEKLKVLARKNRPDFYRVEDDILSVVQRAKFLKVDESSVSNSVSSLRGFSERAKGKDVVIRRGMSWKSLKDFAIQTSEFVRSRHFSSFNKLSRDSEQKVRLDQSVSKGFFLFCTGSRP